MKKIKYILNCMRIVNLIREFDNFKWLREFLKKQNLTKYYDTKLIHDSEYDVSPELLNTLEDKIKVMVNK